MFITMNIVRLVLACSLMMVQPEPQTTLTIGENCYVLDVNTTEYNTEKVSYITYENSNTITYWD